MSGACWAVMYNALAGNHTTLREREGRGVLCSADNTVCYILCVRGRPKRHEERGREPRVWACTT